MIIKALYTQIIVFFLLILSSVSLHADDIDHITETSSIKPITIGIFPRRDPVITMRLFSPLAKYI